MFTLFVPVPKMCLSGEILRSKKYDGGGLGTCPAIIGICAWLYVRAATKNEAQYRDLVEEK
ncbi:hypothetical protein [Specibacter sp. NPDC078709]|uniref:hypothetical protein n=1 Tax=Specibacter sp. NPDC078709 TaxID=3154364 RepID=UPI003416F7CA